jgi:hypothetical protein
LTVCSAPDAEVVDTVIFLIVEIQNPNIQRKCTSFSISEAHVGGGGFGIQHIRGNDYPRWVYFRRKTYVREPQTPRTLQYSCLLKRQAVDHSLNNEEIIKPKLLHIVRNLVDANCLFNLDKRKN